MTRPRDAPVSHHTGTVKHSLQFYRISRNPTVWIPEKRDLVKEYGYLLFVFQLRTPLFRRDLNRRAQKGSFAPIAWCFLKVC